MSCVPGASIIVAKQSFLGVTASISETTIFTPASEGDFRVNIYCENHDVGSHASLGVALNWTDNVAAQTFGTLTAPSEGYAQASVVIHSASGDAIQISATYSTDGPLHATDVYVTVVQE